MVEIWEKITGTNGVYEVSSLGRIKSFARKNPTILNGVLENHGYLSIRYAKKRDLIHRVVAKHFVDNPDNKKTVNHIDGNKLNNRCDNLEYMSIRENLRHGRENGLNPLGGNNYEENKKLRKIMLEKGISKSDLAKYLGRTPATIYVMMRKDIFIRQKNIAKFLGVNVEDLID